MDKAIQTLEVGFDVLDEYQKSYIAQAISRLIRRQDTKISANFSLDWANKSVEHSGVLGISRFSFYDTVGQAHQKLLK